MGVYLRAIEPDDIEVLYDWENGRSLWQLSNTIAPFSKYVLSKYLETAHLDIFQTRQLRLMIDIEQANGEAKTIGAVDLFDYEPMHSRAGVGILIGDNSEKGKGYASGAIEGLKDYCENALQLHQLYCNIEIINHVSLSLFKKHGFEEIGVKKDWNKTPTGYIDEVILQFIF